MDRMLGSRSGRHVDFAFSIVREAERDNFEANTPTPVNLSDPKSPDLHCTNTHLIGWMNSQGPNAWLASWTTCRFLLLNGHESSS